MLSFAIQPGVGAVGARLWYPGGGLQHAGVILGLIGIASHVHRNLRRGELGYFARAALASVIQRRDRGSLDDQEIDLPGSGRS